MLAYGKVVFEGNDENENIVKAFGLPVLPLRRKDAVNNYISARWVVDGGN
jgi:hypothetical protein